MNENRSVSIITNENKNFSILKYFSSKFKRLLYIEYYRVELTGICFHKKALSNNIYSKNNNVHFFRTLL